MNGTRKSLLGFDYLWTGLCSTIYEWPLWNLLWLVLQFVSGSWMIKNKFLIFEILILGFNYTNVRRALAGNVLLFRGKRSNSWAAFSNKFNFRDIKNFDWKCASWAALCALTGIVQILIKIFIRMFDWSRSRTQRKSFKLNWNLVLVTIERWSNLSSL